MPTPPTYLEKINYIVQFWSNPCNAPILVYLELAKAPAGKAILMWLTFGFLDIQRGFWRPSKALGGRRSARRGKRGRKPRRIPLRAARAGRAIARLPGIGDDTGGWLGKQISGAQEVKGRHIGQGQINFWILDDMGQKILFALLIADIGIDFLYEWATLVDQSIYCQRTQSGVLYATGPGTAAGGVVICAPGNAANVIYKEGDVGWVVATASVGIRGWHALSAMVVTNASPFPVTHYQEFYIQDRFGVRTIRSEEQVLGVGVTKGSILKTEIYGPGSFVSVHCCYPGVVVPTSHDVTIWGGETRTPPPYVP